MRFLIDIANATIWQRVTIADTHPVIVHPHFPDRPLRAERIVIGWMWTRDDGWHALDITFHGKPINPDGPGLITFGMPVKTWPDDVTAIIQALKPSTAPEGAASIQDGPR